MIRKLKSGEYRLYSRKKNPKTGKRRNLGFRKWLEVNHENTSELLVGFHKRGSGRASMTWPESVDAALCFGWIDGVRRRVDDDCYTIRFTPRKASSIWSTVNIGKMKELLAADLVRPAGARVFERRSLEKSSIYAYENRHAATLDADRSASSSDTRGRGNSSNRARRGTSAPPCGASSARSDRRRAPSDSRSSSPAARRDEPFRPSPSPATR